MINKTFQLTLLGNQRLRLLGCLGGDSPHALGYFDPAPGMDIFAAFRHYVTSMSQRLGSNSDPLSKSLLAAARVLTGDLDSAEIILDYLPAKAFKLNHGAGYCALMPQKVLKNELAFACRTDRY